MKNLGNPRKYLGLAILLPIGQIIIGSPASYAQGTMSDKAMEKSRFYNAPREYQIVDDRPVIRDFREAPAVGKQIGLPGGPGGGGSGGGGAGGLGDLGGGSGANPVIPAGGMPLGDGTSPDYRTAPAGLTGLGSLPKSGFGVGGSNIPARGMGPRGILPGVNMGVVGKIMSQNKPVAAAATPMQGLSLKGPSGGGSPSASSAPAVTSYGGYGNHPSTSYGNSSRTEQNVRGYLLRSK